jgi:hypothetical protein
MYSHGEQFIFLGMKQLKLPLAFGEFLFLFKQAYINTFKVFN